MFQSFKGPACLTETENTEVRKPLPAAAVGGEGLGTWKQVARLVACFLWDLDRIVLLLWTFPHPGWALESSEELCKCWALPLVDLLTLGCGRWDPKVPMSVKLPGDSESHSVWKPPLASDFTTLVCPAHLATGELPRARAFPPSPANFTYFLCGLYLNKSAQWT